MYLSAGPIPMVYRPHSDTKVFVILKRLCFILIIKKKMLSAFVSVGQRSLVCDHSILVKYLPMGLIYLSVHSVNSVLHDQIYCQV